MSEPPAVARLRREPPTFRELAVRRTETLTPRMMRVTIGGDELNGFEMPDPAGSVRLLLPEPGAATITMPVWNGNEFLHDDGSRPALRTVTPRHHRSGDNELDVDVVLHGPTPLATWAQSADAGTPVAMSGPGRGYEIDATASGFLLVGDESALPAIAQLLEAIPRTTPVTVLAEVSEPSGRMTLPRADAAVTWFDQPTNEAPGSTLVDAVRGAEISGDTAIWVAGEAAAVQSVRRHLFNERSIPRSRAVVRGYWKHGRERARP